MPSSERGARQRATRRRPAGVPSATACALLLAALAAPSEAWAQVRPQGFAVERTYPSPAGAGWFLMDDLAMDGGPAVAAGLSGDQAHRSLTVSRPGGAPPLAVVQDQAYVFFSLAATYDRYRLSLDLPAPVYAAGTSGAVGAYPFTAPALDLGRAPDLVSDPRIGIDVRLVGGAHDPFRAGVSAQLFIPSGDRADYVTDGTYRAMIRALLGGDLGSFSYAGQVGVHVRPLDDTPVPGGPRGSELLFGAAAGREVALGDAWTATVGPEIQGATAFRAFLAGDATALEGLLGARFEPTGDGPRVRFKLAAGGGLHAQFGAPEWRALVGVEVTDRLSARGAETPAFLPDGRGR